MADGTVFGDVDVFASEHRIAASLNARGHREFEERGESRIVD